MSSPQAADQALPAEFPVRVLMRREPVQDNPWVDHRWSAVGITTGDPDGVRQTSSMEIENALEVLFCGHRVAVYRDECESYYHNLVAPEPQCYVLTRNDESGVPEPFQISLSFDEANAYLETDDVDVHPVPMPPELYRWVEAFVLANYVPEPRKKRKRADWHQEGRQ